MTGAEWTRMLGQRLSVGFYGTEVPEELKRLIREYKIGNIILFRRNVAGYAQLKKLCAELRQLIRTETGLEPYIMIDEECGSVSRLAKVAAPTPSAMAIGATGKPENAHAIGRLIGEELRAAGINFNLAPVLDCSTRPDNQAEGNRCFAGNPEDTAALGRAYVRGVQETGVLACGKHFPGSGDTLVDSHLDLPIIEKPAEEIEKTELVPFRAAIAEGVKGIMTAHIVFPAMEPERVPATVSRRVVTGLLRERMGFGGIIVSDGMEMHAVMDLYGIEDGTRRALAAGVDIALICHSYAQTEATAKHLLESVQNGTLDPEETEIRFRHIERMKKEIAGPEGGEESFGSAAQRATAEQIMRAAIRLDNAPGNAPLPALDGETVLFGVPAQAGSLASDREALEAARFIAARYAGRFMEIGEAAASDAQTAVLFLKPQENAPAAVAAAKALLARGTKLIAVALDTPACLKEIPDTAWKVLAWQYDEFVLPCLAEFLQMKKK